MYSIMISMQAKEIASIACGKKRALLIKKRPSLFELPMKIYFYENKGKLKHTPNIAYTAYRHEGRGMVVGECVCHSFKTSDIPVYDEALKRQLDMTMRDFAEYFEETTGYIMFFDEVKIYEQPINVGAFGKKTPPQSWYHIDEDERRAY